MSQSLVKNLVHLVFSTKFRQPLIQSPVDDELYRYLAGICNKQNCQVIEVGGYVDHVHILFALAKDTTLFKVVKEIKGSSSLWIKGNGGHYRQFYWQDGYGAFSVSPSAANQVAQYIVNQKTHHQSRSFQDEYRDFLREHNIEYDERYVWD